METDEQRLLQQIETATSRDLSPEARMEAETQEWRAGWTAMMHLLEEADRGEPLPELAWTNPMHRPETAPVLPHRGGHWRRRVLAWATVAAAVMIAAIVAWQSTRQSATPAPDMVQGGPEVSTDAALVDGSSDSNASDVQEDYSWEDDLDDRFTDLTQQIAGMQGNGLLLDSPFYWLDQRIEELQEKMDEL